MNLQICLKLADCAKKDSSLIKNHTDGAKGVDHYLREHLNEVNYLISVVDKDPDFINNLELEKIAILSALSVYSTEFKVGDLVTFKPYEKAIPAKVVEIVPCKKITFVKDDDRTYYRLTGAGKTPLVSITTGNSIVESSLYKGEA